jgi:hypothetical protein
LNPKLFTRLSAIVGVIGVVMLIISFNINPGPPANATPDELVAFGQANYASVLWGSWLQVVGPFFILAFAFAIVVLVGEASSWCGIMTFFGGVLLMVVSLTEVAFYISALSGTAVTAQISLDLIHAVQHMYFFIGAPALFVPLGLVVLKSQLLPRSLGYLAIMLGFAFEVVGVTFLYSLVLPPYVLAFAGVQVVWWLAAAIVLFLRADRVASWPLKTLKCSPSVKE